VRYLVIGVIALVALILAANLAGTDAGPVAQEALFEQRVYAYRDWQSVGLWVHPGEAVTVQAAGAWLYTPAEYHGPEGHPRYPAPSFYPLSRIAGGALLGRVGEKGVPFYVGKWARFQVNDFGLLYFRINDDILSDNEGWVSVKVTVEEPKRQ
jgi:hypothetical protein